MHLILIFTISVTFVEIIYSFRTRFSFYSIDNTRKKCAINPYEFDPAVISAMRSAARMGDAEKLRALTSNWSHHPILNDKVGDMMGLTLLHWAVAAGQSTKRIECLRILLDAGSNIEALNNAGNTPLHYAAATGKDECTSYLIERGANVDTKSVTSFDQTPLHFAASRGYIDCGIVLISKGASINLVDKNGDTALHLSNRFGKSDFTDLLLANGADKSIKNLDGKLPLEVAPLTVVNESYE